MKQFVLLLLVIFAGAVALRLYTSRMHSNFEKKEDDGTLTAREGKAFLEEHPEAILLDVRRQEEYDQGHIAGAVLLPNEEIHKNMPVAFDKDAIIVVYCRSGRRSADAASKLRDMGYTRVYDMGGIQDWPYGTTKE